MTFPLRSRPDFGGELFLHEDEIRDIRRIFQRSAIALIRTSAGDRTAHRQRHDEAQAGWDARAGIERQIY
jgi:hypothetical protein